MPEKDQAKIPMMGFGGEDRITLVMTDREAFAVKRLLRSVNQDAVALIAPNVGMDPEEMMRIRDTLLGILDELIVMRNVYSRQRDPDTDNG